MTKRRMGTCPHRTCWTVETVQQIEAYQRTQHIPSFSAAAETLVRIGLAQAPAAVLAPIVTSAVRQAVHRELDRLMKLQVYTAIEAGIAQRFAAAAVRDVGRLKHDDPERFTRIREAAIADTRRRLHRDNISAIIADLYADVTQHYATDTAARLPNAPAETERG